MTCKGCGEDLSLLEFAVSRYEHGDICTDCGILEAMHGDFIQRYWDEYSPNFPLDTLKMMLMNGKA